MDISSQEKPKVHIPWMRYAVAAMIALVAGIGIYWIGRSHNSEVEWTDAYAKIGETREVTLPDNSKVELKSGSKIVYPTQFTQDQREIFLIGEAYMDISKDPKHPFIINGNDVKVKVLGTKLDVQAFPEESEVEVALYEGSVEIKSDLNKKPMTRMMKPGDIMKIDCFTGDTTSVHIDGLAYVNGRKSYYFLDQRLGDIMHQLELNTGTKIVVTDQDLAKERYFAIFANGETLNQMLDQLNATHNMTIRHISDQVIEIGRR